MIYPTPVLVRAGSFEDAESSRSFSYFWERTSSNLSGDLDQSFWKVFVLQFSNTQPAIKHMLLAIGSLHESLDLSSSTTGDDRIGKLQLLAFEHHHAAIQLLKDSAEDLETALVSCILFICFETLQRDFVSTVSVLRSGLQVLAQWRSSTAASQRPSTIKAEVVPVICSITRQLSNFVEAAAVGISPQAQCYDSACLNLAPAVELPTTFLNLQHARDSLAAVIDHGYGFVDPVWRTPDHTLSADFDYQTQILLRAWYTRFSACTFDNGQTQKEAESIKIQYHVACIMTAPLHREGEMLFDDCAEKFETIISLGEHLLELDKANGDSPSWKPISGEPEELRPGMIPALALCAMRCRCPRIRRRAVAVLKSRSWREGFSHSGTAAIIAEKVIDVEEEGLDEPRSCSDIKFSKRIRVLRVDRVTGVYSPTDYQGSFSDVPGIWSVPRTRLDTHFASEPAHCIRFVRYPWNATSPVEEMWLNVAS